MILANKDKSLYKSFLCISSKELIDEVWGDCSISEGTWYDVIEEDGGEFILVRFGDWLCPHEKKFFITAAKIRDQKIKNILDQNDDEYCYYSNLPSPSAYKNNNE
jgi:hypothetical protein